MKTRFSIWRPTVALGIWLFVANPQVAAQPLALGIPGMKVRRDLLIVNSDVAWDLLEPWAMAVDSHENVYVWDISDHRIRAYDASGRPKRTYGRKGDGPGEISQIGSLAVLGDTLWVVENVTNRVTGFALHGDKFKTDVIRPITRTTAGVIAKLQTGYLAAEGVNKSMSGAFFSIVIDGAGTKRSTIGGAQGTPKILTYDVIQENVRGGPVVARQMLPQPLSPNIPILVTPDGTGFVSATIRTDVFGAPSALVITRLNIRGDTVWSTATPYKPSKITPEEHKKIVDNLVAPTVLRNMRIVGKREMIEDSLIQPTYWPAFTKSLMGSDGAIWLRQGGLANGTDSFWKFSSTGKYELNVQLPNGFRLMAATSSKLWGIRKDADGTPFIERYNVYSR